MPIPGPIPGIEKQNLVVGEGKGDLAFLKYLCQHHSLTDFQPEEAGGTGKFPLYLQGLSSRSNFDNLRRLLVVADNDETPDESFNRIRGYLKKAQLPFPQEPLKIKRNHPDGLGTAVMMLPFNNETGSMRGCLESLLILAINDHRPEVKNCVDSYYQCVLGNWTKFKEDKFRVRCSIAAMWPEDPNFGLQFALDPVKNMIPLAHSCFDEVVEFLKKFPTL